MLNMKMNYFYTEANHNKDYSVVNTFTAVPPYGGIVVFADK